MNEDLNTRNSVASNASEMTSSAGSETTAAEKASVEELRKQIRALTNECNGLREILPRLKDKNGEDVIREMVKMGEELNRSRMQVEQWENDYAALNENFNKTKRRMHAELGKREDEIAEMQKRAKEIEADYEMLKKQVEDEASKLCKRKDGEMDEHIGEMAANESLNESTAFPDLTSKTGTTANRSLNDIEYVIGQMMGVMMQLEINSEDAEELRKKIVKFLRDHGHHVSPQNVAMLAKEFEDKLKANEVRAGNRELGRHYDEGNLELQVRVQELSQDLSVAPSEISRPMLSSRAPADHVMGRMRLLRGVCNQLFEKLQGTAHFLQTILDNLGDSDEARELIQKISEIHLDLNKSMGEAQLLADGIRGELSSYVDETAEDGDDDGMRDDTRAEKISELVQEVERLRAVQKERDAIKASLNSELAMKEDLKQKLDEFEEMVADLQLAIKREQTDRENLKTQKAALQEAVQGLKQDKITMEEHLRKAASTLATKEAELGGRIREKTALEEKLLKAQSSVEAKVRALADSNKHRETLEKKVHALEMSLGKHNAQLIDSDKARCDAETELERHRQLVDEKELKIEELNRRAKQSTDVIRKNNKELYERIKSGMNQSVVIAEPIPDEEVSNVQELNNFLEDCQSRANNVIQCLKAVSQGMATDERGVEIPDLETMLGESRSLRFMLYRLRLFFTTHKENLTVNKKFSAGIIAELRGIYETLQTASKSSHVIAQSSHVIAQSKKSQSNHGGQK